LTTVNFETTGIFLGQLGFFLDSSEIFWQPWQYKMFKTQEILKTIRICLGQQRHLWQPWQY